MCVAYEGNGWNGETRANPVAETDEKTRSNECSILLEGSKAEKSECQSNGCWHHSPRSDSLISFDRWESLLMWRQSSTVRKVQVWYSKRSAFFLCVKHACAYMIQHRPLRNQRMFQSNWRRPRRSMRKKYCVEFYRCKISFGSTSKNGRR